MKHGGLAIEELHSSCAAAIRKGSKTFAFASFFFGKEEFQASCLLYTWCRHCDDQIDEVPQAEKAQRLVELERLTHLALETEESVPLEFAALRHVVRKYSIPHFYALELLQGMRMDVENQRYQTIDELLLYCYRVAGVVGLMMSHIMGVSDRKAQAAACDLGLAMQLTNCSRDVLADFANDRLYLPMNWLRDAVGTSEITDLSQVMANRTALVQVVEKMLLKADQLYEASEPGTKYLPTKSALVILIARFTYARIGTKVRAAGTKAWDRRAYTKGYEKVFCFIKAIGTWLRQLPGRSAFRRVNHLEIYKLNS